MGRLASDQTERQAGEAVDRTRAPEAVVVRRRVRVTGLVQGVGFRPHVWRLATALGLAGWVLNSPDGVVIEIQGPPAAVDTFLRDLRARPPRLARIASVKVDHVPSEDPSLQGFVILASRDEGARRTLVSADIAVCEACRRELVNPRDRRFGYPFTNCTDCGPRYTIIKSLPYDRPLTSMAAFPMCADCRGEYENPADRRFHAQPNACPACGPRVWIEDREGKVVTGPGAGWREVFHFLVADGAIVAVKGLGGFHLACDATSEPAVAKLRARKKRPFKPFAVMAKDLETVRRYVRVGPEAERLLLSPAAPIVILPLRSASGEDGSARLGGGQAGRPGGGEPGAAAPSLAPGSPTLGVMLAYTPLHLLLFGDGVDLLVMTSANPSDLPIVRDNEAARAGLGGVADYFLMHDREIVNRCEDSVLRVVDGSGRGPFGAALTIPYRRSRGYAPSPLDVSPCLPRPAAGDQVSPPGAILGAGAEMKNTFCLTRGTEAFLSPHLGEMGTSESLAAYRETYDRYLTLLGTSPQVVAYDPHPGYLVSRFALGLTGARPATGPTPLARARAPGDPGPATAVPLAVPVFHHHAHMVSCLADNGLAGDKEVLGVICDGTGYGPDGAIWGFEVLAGTAAGFRRLGHLAYVPLPGGDVSARRPFRSAAAHLYQALGPDGVARLARLHPGEATDLALVRASLDGSAARPAAGVSTVPVSSAGRLFDAVAAMAGIKTLNTYEGEAAVALSDLLEPADGTGLLNFELPERYRFRVGGAEPTVIDPAPCLASLLADVEADESRRRVSLVFHRAVVEAVTEALLTARRRTGLARVVLSGGTFQNPFLVQALGERLTPLGFEVLVHRQVPPNDGGLALGQAVAGAWMARDRRQPPAGTPPRA